MDEVKENGRMWINCILDSMQHNPQVFTIDWAMKFTLPGSLFFWSPFFIPGLTCEIKLWAASDSASHIVLLTSHISVFAGTGGMHLLGHTLEPSIHSCHRITRNTVLSFVFTLEMLEKLKILFVYFSSWSSPLLLDAALKGLIQGRNNTLLQGGHRSGVVRV